MRKKWKLDDESFRGLLNWLDSDPHAAGIKYERIRKKLIIILESRGCPVAEELTDITFDRVSKKVADISSYYEGDPSLFFFGVANKVYLEWRRNSIRLQREPPAPSPATSTDKEMRDQCLTSCMSNLSIEDSKLLLDYYRLDGQSKIDLRKTLAAGLGISDNALKIKIHRLRALLRNCLSKCLAEHSDDLT